MEKGSKYYSINGRLTKLGKEDRQKDYLEMQSKFIRCRDQINELPFTAQDHKTITDILNKRIADFDNRLAELNKK